MLCEAEDEVGLPEILILVRRSLLNSYFSLHSRVRIHRFGAHPQLPKHKGHDQNLS